MKRLLVVVDMQRDFVEGALGTPEARAVLPQVLRRIERARAEGDTVVFTRDTHGENYLSTQEGRRLPVTHCLRGTDGWQIEPSLHAEGALVFDKGTFGSLRLGEYAAAERFDEIELIGVCTDICVLSNAVLLKAFCSETRVLVRAACCAGVTPERHFAALEAMRACQIDIV